MKELKAEEVRKSCPAKLIAELCARYPEDIEVFGQERAIKALEIGLGIRGKGYNIFISGYPGTGRISTARRFLGQEAIRKKTPNDWCYVYNFQAPYRPRALSLPPGYARRLKKDMSELAQEVQQTLKNVFESDDYIARKDEIFRNLEKNRDKLISELREAAQAEGFLVEITPRGIFSYAAVDNRPMSEEEFAALSDKRREEMLKKQDNVQKKMDEFNKSLRKLEKGGYEEIKKMDADAASFSINPLIQELTEKYQALKDVTNYLKEVQKDILDNAEILRMGEPQQAGFPFNGKDGPALMKNYQVNILVDNSELKGAPVIYEMNPTYNNLFGRIEKESHFGSLVTDFSLIREGCLHRANGGYLLLHVKDLLKNFFAWEGLIKALRSNQIEIEEAGERLGFITSKSLQPEPVPLDLKIILVGEPVFYHLLSRYEEDFGELFKVKAEFDIEMANTEENIRNYISFVHNYCKENSLRHLTGAAIAKITEFGSRLAEDQQKLSTRFNNLGDIITEADYYAAREEASEVTAENITKAIEEKHYRSNLLQEKIMEMLRRDIIRINTEESETGQINGLAYISLGDLAFGRPNRISATVALGKEGVIDIEREAKLGGKIHSKGVMIISGYLAEKFAANMPLALTARIVFEQSYSEVEGDSASGAELYALLSALAGLPLSQGIAVTGSVNQKGEVQAIGGINEKIEGFFELCRLKGLNGKQGVMIPASNVSSLMLKEEVSMAVAEGKFHIWAVESVEEGIEILTGVKAGQRTEGGRYEKDSVFARVEERLKQMMEKVIELNRDKEKETI